MGHLGLLSLYLNYYEKTDRNRIVHIWPEFAPNKFYLKKILENRNLEVISETGKPPKYISNMNLFDNFILSRIEPGNWRFEPMAVTSTGQKCVDFSNDYYINHSLNQSEIEEGWVIAKELGICKDNWFVILHIREALVDADSHIQNRDADVFDYIEMCEQVVKLGGIVIRMGSQSFSKLNDSFPAIDYAHSQFKSEFMDVWLWGQCKFWIGNSNGAATPPLFFKKPRINTNQWPWIAQGPSQDIFLPKLMKNVKDEFLNIEETIKNKYGRLMSKSEMKSKGYRLVPNSGSDLIESVKIMYKTQVMHEAMPSMSKDIDVLKQNLKVNPSDVTMHLPSFFKLN
jgi:putative glycosyltransferase (TIGR04372 family)